MLASPELPSVLQRWIDHEAAHAELVVAVAGSSQRMMQGLVLEGSAPLYGRAREILDLGPIGPEYLTAAFNQPDPAEQVELFTAWGGVPSYWELARDVSGTVTDQIDRLVLDPLGPLHREPDRLLLEELPPAIETRPVLDAIGAGAHRVPEIAGRIGRPATSMSRPLRRLIAMGLVRREVPFGESEKKSRRSLYRIADPFFRLRVVAPSRAVLAAGPRASRLDVLGRNWPGLAGAAWEDLCRMRLPHASGLDRPRPAWAVGASGTLVGRQSAGVGPRQPFARRSHAPTRRGEVARCTVRRPTTRASDSRVGFSSAAGPRAAEARREGRTRSLRAGARCFRREGIARR